MATVKIIQRIKKIDIHERAPFVVPDDTINGYVCTYCEHAFNVRRVGKRSVTLRVSCAPKQGAFLPAGCPMPGGGQSEKKSKSK